LNEGHNTRFRGVRVALGTGYTRVSGYWAIVAKQRRELPPTLTLRFATFSHLADRWRGAFGSQAAYAPSPRETVGVYESNPIAMEGAMPRSSPRSPRGGEKVEKAAGKGEKVEKAADEREQRRAAKHARHMEREARREAKAKAKAGGGDKSTVLDMMTEGGCTGLGGGW
jgi:hypothetical protein